MYTVDILTAQKIQKEFGTPTFITSEDYLLNQLAGLKSSFDNSVEVFYAIKSNFNPHLVSSLKKGGLNGIDAVSPYEVMLAKNLRFTNDQIIFTGNNLSNEELEFAKHSSVIVNIGSIAELKRFGIMFPNSEISIRINPDVGDGEFQNVITGGKNSKFGIPINRIDDILNITSFYNLKVIGLHSHIGSGMREPSKFKIASDAIFKLLKYFKTIKIINLGGGFGVRYKPSDTSINLTSFYKAIENNIQKIKQGNKDIRIIVEPGKFLTAESTCLLTKITTIRDDFDSLTVALDTGMNHIIRPALYSAYHHIINISNQNADMVNVKIVGNICESTDVISESISIQTPREGDLLLVLTAGSYCSSMSSHYNLRPFAAEIMISNKNEVILSRKRDSLEDMMRCYTKSQI